MLKSIVALIACSSSYVVIAHPHCHYNLREVNLDGELNFCSMDYAPFGICCTAAEETALETTFDDAGDLTPECADYYKQMLCGVCGSYSGHLYERFAFSFEEVDGLTMKSEFCTELTTACDGQIDFPDYDGVGYCMMHTGGGDDLYWSYPFEQGGVFDGEFIEVFPDLPELPSTTIAVHPSPDGSMFWIAGKDGLLIRVEADSMSSSSTVMDFTDSDVFFTSFEEGLLDFAFSPMFDTNAYFYVSWTADDPFHRNRLSKFQYFEGDPDATLDSEELLLQTDQRARFFHNGGWLGFKPGDYGKSADYHELYWALGDSGPQEDPFDNSQRTDTYFGSVVRILVPSDGTGYEVPDGNYAGSELPEICAIGFRNIWRCGFDRLTDDLYCGDVGHIFVESIDIIECGNNYGWVRFEGSRCTEYSEDAYGPCADVDRSDFTFPFFEYCHDGYSSSPSSEDEYTGGVDICGDGSIAGNAIIGGYVYRGQTYADILYGAYVFGDHEFRNIYYVRQEDDGTMTTGTIITSGLKLFSFAEDSNGELIIIDADNGVYYMPCGDLCIPEPGDDDSTTTPDDDSTTTPDDDSTTTPGEDDSTTTPGDDDSTTTPGDDDSTTTPGDDDSTTTPGDDDSTTTPGDDDSTTTPGDDDFSSLYEYLGCYGDQDDRVLSGRSLAAYSGMTTEFCAGFCTGSAYFGTQYGIQCYCGEAMDDPTILGTADCGTSCGGDPSLTCGGKWALSVHQYTM